MIRTAYLPLLCIFSFYFGGFALPGYAQEALSAESGMRHITVTAQAQARVASKTALLTFSLQGEGANASSANAAIEATLEAVTKSLAAVQAGIKMSTRGSRFESAVQSRAPLVKSASVKVERLLGVETDSLDKVPSLLDAALKAGAAEAEVEYLAPDSDPALDEAGALAAKRALEKAKLTAAAFGSRLGETIEVNITEEVPGSLLRQQMQSGKDISRFSERFVQVYATARFRLLNQ
jgi:uncharacterized protein YggE